MTSAHEQLAADIGLFRRGLIPDFMLELLRRVGDAEPSLLQVATLYVLDAGSRPTVRDLAARIGRSMSATSRMVDQLVRRGWVDRGEDPDDRRAKRLELTPAGSDFLRGFERARATAQLALTRYLTDDEQRLVSEAMALLGKASRRYIDERDTATNH